MRSSYTMVTRFGTRRLGRRAPSTAPIVRRVIHRSWWNSSRQARVFWLWIVPAYPEKEAMRRRRLAQEALERRYFEQKLREYYQAHPIVFDMSTARPYPVTSGDNVGPGRRVDRGHAAIRGRHILIVVDEEDPDGQEE